MSASEILDVMLGQHDTATRVRLLRLWQDTLKAHMPEVEPEASQIADLIEWLETVAQALEAA